MMSPSIGEGQSSCTQYSKITCFVCTKIAVQTAASSVHLNHEHAGARVECSESCVDKSVRGKAMRGRVASESALSHRRPTAVPTTFSPFASSSALKLQCKCPWSFGNPLCPTVGTREKHGCRYTGWFTFLVYTKIAVQLSSTQRSGLRISWVG
jgi:hypothetical protein